MTMFTLAGEFQDALVTALQARPGLADVHVARGPLGDSAESGDKFHIGESEAQSVSASVTWASSGGYSWNETVSIECVAIAYDYGAGEEAIKNAYDRAYAIVSEVWDEIVLNADQYSGATSRPLLLGGKVRSLMIPDWTEDRFVDRASRIRLTIRFEGGPLQRS